MDLLFGALISVAMEGFKWMTSKFGRTHTREGILIITFAIVFVVTGLTQAHIISMATLQALATTYAASITTYEIIIKTALSLISQYRQAK